MNAGKRQTRSPRLMLLLGIAGLGLRFALNTFCLDRRQLFPALHPLVFALEAVTAAAVGLALYISRKQKAVDGYLESLPGSKAALLGHILAALGILLTAVEHGPSIQGNLGFVWRTLAFASVPCLIAAGWLRLQGKQPVFVLHLCPCLFLAMHTINQYQAWSSDPQLLNYMFSLLGIICMVLFAFYHCTFDVGFSWRRRLTFFGLTSVCLGLMALPGNPYPWLYLGITLWALLDLPAEGTEA